MALYPAVPWLAPWAKFLRPFQGLSLRIHRGREENQRPGEGSFRPFILHSSYFIPHLHPSSHIATPSAACYHRRHARPRPQTKEIVRRKTTCLYPFFCPPLLVTNLLPGSNIMFRENSFRCSASSSAPCRFILSIMCCSGKILRLKSASRPSAEPSSAW